MNKKETRGGGIVPPIATTPDIDSGSGIVPPIGQLPGNGIVPPIGQLPGNGSGIVPPIATCLGASSAIYATVLQNFIVEELQIARTFQNLARRYPRQGRTLRRLAADNLDTARELRSAYFIITGIQFIPNDYEALFLPNSYEAALRTMYNYLDGMAERYRNTADAVQDDCLQELYYRAATNIVDQRNMVRSLISQL